MSDQTTPLVHKRGLAWQTESCSGAWEPRYAPASS